MRESGWLYGDLSGNVRWKMVEVGKVIVGFSACVCVKEVRSGGCLGSFYSECTLGVYIHLTGCPSLTLLTASAIFDRVTTELHQILCKNAINNVFFAYSCPKKMTT